ncbi:hypothetical protein K1719_013745 [Acacia pycnantha]|nr:hypothetical protein K1719_013745 [Acacia pycnantha]
MKLRDSSEIFAEEEEDGEREFGGRGTYIKKGPWSAEEDEILMKHVKKNGPRDWSSIRSKGLLPRTGKSCRLRWVNKLRPNLKTGCKFSAEEETAVIELQAEFGNKWAKIATYLEGRTDNDVKNFWSSRRKRLERMLQKPSPSPSSKPNNKNKATSQIPHQPPQVPALNQVEQNPSGNNKHHHVVEVKAEEATPLDTVPSLFESCSSDYTFSQVLLPDVSHHQVDYGGLLPPPMCHGLLDPEPFGDATFLDLFEQHKKPGGIFQTSSIPTNAFFEDFPCDLFDYFEDLPNSLDK